MKRLWAEGQHVQRPAVGVTESPEYYGPGAGQRRRTSLAWRCASAYCCCVLLVNSVNTGVGDIVTVPLHARRLMIDSINADRQDYLLR